MTTENVAILFTDIVGSTELSQRLSAEVADEVRRGHFSLLRQAIADTGGTEVKNLGDGVMVVFASASSALECGVAMQQLVEQSNRGGAEAVGLRVGISGGEVDHEEDDYFGDPVVEAARLCARCATSQVLAADIVPAMAGRRNKIEHRVLGDLELKGLPDPLATVEVLWEPLEGVGGGVPLPDRLTLRPGVGVVGRTSELEILADACKRVSNEGVRELVLVSGEAGQGKTTFVFEAARTAFDQGACVLLGRCEEDLATPYQLLAEALTHYVVHAPEELLLAHVEAYGSELARLVPALGQRIPDLPRSTSTDPDTERYLLLAAVAGLVAAISQEQPVVLVLDDLQWADTGSLQVLRHLMSTDQSMRMLVIGTYRDNELSRANPLLDTLGTLRRQSGVSRIDLRGFDDDGVVAFLEAAAGHSLDEAGTGLALAVYRETDGNPFFVSEVLRHLVDTGAIFCDDDGRWVGAEGLEGVILPDSLREVIGARVARLDERAQRTLSLASVIGRDFEFDVLALVAESSEDALLDDLDAAAEAALVREHGKEPGRYSFTHALIQRTLYEDLGPTRRARVHHRVGEALEDLCGDRPGARVGDLARHWFSATVNKDLTKALDYSRLAADSALAELAPGDALRYYQQAIDLYAQVIEPDPALGIDLAIGLGTAQRQTGDPAYRETLLDAARRADAAGDAKRLATAALANDRGFFSSLGVVDADRVAILEMALERTGSDDVHRAQLLANLCKELAFGGSLEQCSALAEEAIGLARSSGDGAALIRVLVHVAVPLLVPERLDQSTERSREALAIAEGLGDPQLIFWAAAIRVLVAAVARDIDEVDRCLEITGGLAEKLNQTTLTWLNCFSHATRALMAGDTARAELLATEALQIGTDGGEPDALSVFGPQLMSVGFQRGTMGDLSPLIEESASSLTGIPAFFGALALSHIDADRFAEARACLEAFAAGGFELPRDALWLTGMTCYAEAAIQCGETEFAGPIFEQLDPVADQLSYGIVTSEGPVGHYVAGLAAVLGRHAEAESRYAECAAFCERVGAVFFAARTDLEWGRMLVGRGGTDGVAKGRVLLEQALASATANGYGTVERRAAAALAELG